MSLKLAHERSSFSLTRGGPFHHLLVRLRLWKPEHMWRCWVLAVVGWLPLMIEAGVRTAAGLAVDPMLFDLSLHARLIVVLPMLLSSEPLLEQTTKSALSSFYQGNFCERVSIDRIADRAEVLRDSRKVELVLLAVAVLNGQLVFWRVFGATGLFHGGEASDLWSFSRVWYALIALPLINFVMFRWLWRWFIWAYMLARMSRLPLTPLSTHPDFAGGLACLARPMTGFSGFVFAMGALLSASWGTQVLANQVPLEAFLPGLVVFLLVALLIATGPLLLFCGHLFRVRRRTLREYGDFARGYTMRFHEKWLGPETAAERALGSSDIQSLNDLGGAYQVIAKSRVFVFGPRNVLAVWAAGIMPMVPLFASALTVEQILKRIMSTVLGGLPI